MFPYSKDLLDISYGSGTELEGLTDLAKNTARGNVGKNLVQKLNTIVFPAGATVAVSGIKHQIVEAFPKEVTGTATGLVDYGLDTDAGFPSYGVAYKIA